MPPRLSASVEVLRNRRAVGTLGGASEVAAGRSAGPKSARVVPRSKSPTVRVVVLAGPALRPLMPVSRANRALLVSVAET